MRIGKKKVKDPFLRMVYEYTPLHYWNQEKNSELLDMSNNEQLSDMLVIIIYEILNRKKDLIDNDNRICRNKYNQNI